ncbi:hypothetical protein [Streptomyces sp. NPDC017529]
MIWSTIVSRTKLRWSLTVDRAERDALRRLAAGCGHTSVEYQPV